MAHPHPSLIPALSPGADPCPSSFIAVPLKSCRGPNGTFPIPSLKTAGPSGSNPLTGRSRPAKPRKEKKAREQQVLADRIAKQKDEAVVEAQLSPIRNQVVGLQEQLAEMSALLASPDAAAVVEINANTTANMARTMDAAEKTRELIDQAEGLQATVGLLATEVETLQQQVIALLRNQQQMINGSFETYSAELQRLRDETNSATVAVGALNTSAQDNREVIEQAANIREESINIAGQEATKAVGEMRDEFLDLMTLSLRALGLSEIDLIQTANAIAVEPSNTATIRRASVERFIEISRKTNAAIEAARGEVRD